MWVQNLQVPLSVAPLNPQVGRHGPSVGKGVPVRSEGSSDACTGRAQLHAASVGLRMAVLAKKNIYSGFPWETASFCAF